MRIALHVLLHLCFCLPVHICRPQPDCSELIKPINEICTGALPMKGCLFQDHTIDYTISIRSVTYRNCITQSRHGENTMFARGGLLRISLNTWLCTSSRLLVTRSAKLGQIAVRSDRVQRTCEQGRGIPSVTCRHAGPLPSMLDHSHGDAPQTTPHHSSHGSMNASSTAFLCQNTWLITDLRNRGAHSAGWW